MKNLEQIILEINSDLKNISTLVEEQKIPENIQVLEEKIIFFSNQIKNFEATEQKAYLTILAVWSEEVKNITEKLNLMMHEIKTNLENLQKQNRAVKGYGYLNN